MSLHTMPNMYYCYIIYLYLCRLNKLYHYLKCTLVDGIGNVCNYKYFNFNIPHLAICISISTHSNCKIVKFNKQRNTKVTWITQLFAWHGYV